MDSLKNNKTIKRIISLFLCVALVFTSINVSKIINNDISGEETTKVEVSVVNSPNIDIILTAGETTTDLSTFEKDIKAALEKKGIDTSNTETLKISAVKTNATDMQNSFSWSQDLSSTIGSISTTSNGVTMKGNPSYLGKNCVYTFPNMEGNIYDFKYNYNISFGDSFNSAGMLLKVNKNGNTLTGYMLSFNNRNTCKTVSGTTAALWKFNWTIGTNSSNIIFYNNSGTPGANQAYLVKSLAISTSGTLHVIADDDNITISGGGLSETKIPIDSSYNGSGFGFYSDHYSHGCSNIGQFDLTSISLDVTEKKSYDKVLLEPQWRDGAYHVIVNVEDTLNSAFTDSAKLGEVLSRTMANNIHFIDWGNDTTKPKMESFIASNDGNGKFTYSNNYNQAIEETADYIISLLNYDTESQYVVIDENVEITVNPPSLKTGATSTDFPNGRWMIHHDYTYYENDLGLSVQTEKYTPNLMCNFDKPGKYDIYFDDELVKEVYAHRKPVADFNIGISGTTVSLSSSSYDLDSYSQGNKGIAKEEWFYKEANASTWTSGKLGTFDSSKIYMIKLVVTDYQGETDEAIKYIGQGAPVASFNYSSSIISKYKTLTINDTSYDPEGYTITGYEWTLKKDGITIGTYSTPVTNFNTSALGLGEYTYSLIVTNNKGTKSEAFTQSFKVIDDTDVPEIIVSPTNCEWKTSQSIQLKFSDADSGFKQWRYVFTDSQDTPTSGWSSFKTTATDSITLSSNGQKYLHIEAYDNAGNVLERSFGVYKIDNDKPVINDVTKNEELHKTTVNIDASDNTSGVDKYAYTTSNIAPTSGWISNQSAIITAPNTYYFWVKDYAGNVSLSHVETVKIKYQVTYDRTTNGGTGSNTTVTYFNGDSVDLTPTATKTATYGKYADNNIYGWQFVGWNTDPNAKEGLESFTMGAEDVTLYAIYKRDVRVKAYYYNGTSSSEKLFLDSVYNNETGIKVTLPDGGSYTADPAGGEWTFKYFTDKSSAQTPENSTTVKYSENTSYTFSSTTDVYAVYSRSVGIQFVSILGTQKDFNTVYGSQYVSAYAPSTLSDITVKTPTAKVPTVDSDNGSWTMKGWTTGTKPDSSISYAEGTNITLSSTQTYYAVYARDIPVKFVSKDKEETLNCGQKFNSYNKTQVSYTSIVAPEIGDYAGWEKEGWTSSTTDISPEYFPDDTILEESAKTYYAIYFKDLTVKFHALDGTGKEDVTTFTEPAYTNAYDIVGNTTPIEVTAPNIGSFTTDRVWSGVHWTSSKTAVDSPTLEQGESKQFTADADLYAVYSSQYSAKFISVAGNVQSEQVVTGDIKANSANMSSTTSAKVTAPSLFNCTYDSKTWTAKGWSKGTAYNSNIDVAEGAEITLTKDETYYGIYTSAYTATFIDYNGSEKRTQTVDVGSKMNSSDMSINVSNANAPAIGIYNDGTSDWVINGWTTSKDAKANKELDSEASFSIDKDTTYYATYTRDVTVNLVDFVAGASTTTKKTAKAYVNSYNIDNKTDASFTIPAQNGHITNGKSWNAVGWTTSSSSSSLGDIKYYSAQTINTNKDITIYAMYTRDITVTYNGNGGTNPASSTGTKVTNASGATSNPLIQITNTIPVRTSLKFANKWLTGIKSGIEYIPGLYYQFTDDTTLYAQWILETVDMTATINWEDNSNVMNSRPEFIRLSVYRDGQKISSHLVSNLDDTISAPTANKTIPADGLRITVDKKTNTMTYTFVDLQKYNPSNGAAYNYTLVQEPFVSENSEVDYSQVVSADTWAVTNVMVDANNKSIEGTIYWYDDSNAWHLRPSEVTITLLKKDPDTNVVTKQTKTVKVGASDSVSYIFEKQAAVNSNKNPYEYTVSINNITLYTITNTGFDFECTLANLPGGFTGGEGNNLIIAADAFNWKGNVAKADDYFATATNEDMSVLVTLKTIKKTWTGSGLNRHEVWNNNQYMTDDKGDVVEYNVIVSPDHNTQVDYLPDGRYELIVHDSSLFDFKKFAAANYELNNATITEENGRYFITFEAKYESSSILNLHAQVILKGWRGYTSIKEYMYQPVHVFGDEWVYGDPASCVEDGFKYHVCVLCGARSSQGEIVPAYGHTFVNGYCIECGARQK